MYRLERRMKNASIASTRPALKGRSVIVWSAPLPIAMFTSENEYKAK